MLANYRCCVGCGHKHPGTQRIQFFCKFWQLWHFAVGETQRKGVVGAFDKSRLFKAILQAATNLTVLSSVEGSNTATSGKLAAF